MTNDDAIDIAGIDPEGGGQRLALAVPEENLGERLDRFLAGALEVNLSRSYIQKLIARQCITVNGVAVKQNYRVQPEDRLVIEIPEPEPLSLEPENIPLEILFEDDSLVVINKQAGLVVHPGPGNWHGTLVNALLYHIKGLSAIGGVERPGIVHRLDKDTAGLMVIAKNDEAHRSLVAAFAERLVRKRYAAIVVGKPREAEGRIELPIGRNRVYRHKMAVDEHGREALTEYRVVSLWNTKLGLYTQLDIALHTGRTHQIRVHMSATGTPIVGDPLYAKKWEKHQVPWLLLCATGLSFTHPRTGKPLAFTVPMPDHVIQFMEKLEKNRL